MDLIDFRRAPGMVVGRISFDVLCPSRRVPVVRAARTRREPTRVKTGGPLRGRAHEEGPGGVFFGFVRLTGAFCRFPLCRKKSPGEHKRREEDK